jgi:hypothetical protein
MPRKKRTTKTPAERDKARRLKILRQARKDRGFPAKRKDD